jgi:hypothetical protein
MKNLKLSLLTFVYLLTLNVTGQYIPQCVSFTPSSDTSSTGTAYFHPNPFFFAQNPINPNKYEFIWTQMNTTPENTWSTYLNTASNLAAGQYKVEVWNRMSNPNTVHYTIVTIPNSTMYQGYVNWTFTGWPNTFYTWQNITPLNMNKSPFCLGKVRLDTNWFGNSYYHAGTSIVNYSQVTILSTAEYGQLAIPVPTVISQTDSIIDSLCSGQYLIDIYNPGMQPEHFYVYIDQITSSELTASIDEMVINKKLVKIIDMMGNKSEITSNKLLIFIYSDGTTEKVFQTNK